MKIDDKLISYQIQQQQTNVVAKGGEAAEGNKRAREKPVAESGAVGQDSIVNISSQSQDALKIETAMAAEADVRKDKVAAVKQQLASNTYKVDNQAVAEKMINAFMEEL